jgi:hypothetical protein
MSSSTPRSKLETSTGVTPSGAHHAVDLRHAKRQPERSKLGEEAGLPDGALSQLRVFQIDLVPPRHQSRNLPGFASFDGDFCDKDPAGKPLG